MSYEDPARRTTSSDVAREAGVSRSTVSYVLNDAPHQKIRSDTRKRVLEAAARLGYAPSAAARALRAGRSDVVLCLLPDWPIGPAAGSFLQEMSAAFSVKGLTFVVHPRLAGMHPIAEVWKAITPAAVLALDELDDDDARSIVNAGIDVAILAFEPTEPREGSITMADLPTGRAQVEYLASNSHRRLGFGYPADARLRHFADTRLDGVRDACARLGLPEPVTQSITLDAGSAAEAIRAWRESDPPVTAICAYNDEIALAILAGMRELGLRAPDDLAIIGADDIPAAALADPPLTTTTAIDLSAGAARIAEAVVRVLSGDHAPSVLEPYDIMVVVRESA
jgi:DNA-binding LacI/PurR family transcriptional regulator